jgi:small ligand-binding sensory domain FIST
MMKSFLHAHAAGMPLNSLLAECFDQLGDIPPEATLGFVYVSDTLSQQFQTIISRLKDQTGIQHWVGGLGVGVIANSHEYYDQPALVIMIADFNEDDFRLLPNFTQGIELSRDLKDWCAPHAFHVALVHADPQNPETQNLIGQLARELPEAFLLGGLTSSRHTAYQVAGGVHHGGLSGVVFSDQITISSNLTQGCTPVGSRHRITQSDRNIAYSLDDRPALDVLNEECGDLIARDWERAANYIFIGLINSGADTNDYTVRQLIGIDENARIFAIADQLETGSDLLFCRRDGSSAQEDMQRMLLAMKSRLQKTPRGGIYVSCLGRGREQFGDNSEEVRLIHSVLGDFPLVGFFASGEIHRRQLYGFTGVLTLFL